MKSLVISDIHDNVTNLKSALDIASTASCDSVICCGDLCSPFIIDVLHSNCEVPVFIVFGNNDGDRISISARVNHANSLRKHHNRIQIHDEFLIAEKNHGLEGIPQHISIVVYHYPAMAKIIAQSGLFEFVFYGHSHKSSLESINTCTFANPGSVMGYIPGPNSEFVPPSCLIVNWDSRELELISF